MKKKKFKYNSPKKLLELDNYIQNQKKNAEKILKKFDKKLIGSFGSARSGPTYALNFGLSKYINYIFDDHQLKKNKYTSFLNRKVYPTNKIYKIRPKLLIILAYLHSKKIIRNNKKYLKEGGNFLLVYPNVKLINKYNFQKIIK